MALNSRPAQPGRKQSMRPPPSARPSTARTLASAMGLTGRTSPAESVTSNSTNISRPLSPSSNVGVKRKERDFEQEAGEETNISVVVRCRGRNDREVRENSGVVVSTDGVKGKVVELSMGPSALSNKSYGFDKVFSPAADQTMLFDEVVAPILDEVLAGFNCTIFAYGQTGTGKTYTMSGDITDSLPLPDGAGIIPRVLHSLFEKIENDDAETSVKCSFIELYNEELRDLLSTEEIAKLKIYDDVSKKGQTATLVQGMEECHIKSATKGLELLRSGSHKRQVAATKCNDLSSRSHTVYTITVYMRRSSETGEDFVSAGKLNLVDLAGSENIQRSGAENKRAAEAGLINKSLLTLGRVINALVEKSSHIPYRESKLTRLLQDSLGGRTKTCIIATLSPAKSNLEETISTLDYAFRAKNIRNKPQVNQMVSKKTLLREFTAEIEKLKSELIATRNRNGVYLTAEGYEEITTESESRRILSEEQRDKLETMEVNLRNKAQELFSLTSNFNVLKKENEAARLALEGTNSVLEKTEIVLAHTRQNLAEETMLREAHQATEENLFRIGQDLISTLGRTSSDVNGLQAKLRRRAELHAVNRNQWALTQGQVIDMTKCVEQKIANFEEQHRNMVQVLSGRMQNFVQDELATVAKSKVSLEITGLAFEASEQEVNEQTGKAHNEMNCVLEEIGTLRNDVKQQVGQGLDNLTMAAQRISAGVIVELETFHSQLHLSYKNLGKEFKTTFDELVKHLNHQQAEADTLRRQIADAGSALAGATQEASIRLSTTLAEEKSRAAEERNNLISQITSLIQSQGDVQEKRLDARVASIQEQIGLSNTAYQQQHEMYEKSMDLWTAKETMLAESVLKSCENVKSKIKKDWTSANEHNAAIQTTTRSVHSETINIVDAQMRNMDVQLQALDDILSRVRIQNGLHHNAHVKSLSGLSTTVKQLYSSISEQLLESTSRTRSLEKDMSGLVAIITSSIEPLIKDVQLPLSDLRSNIQATSLTEYTSTGSTPQKIQYQYAQTLPHTESHAKLLENFRNPRSPSRSRTSEKASPTKSIIFADADTEAPTNSPCPTLSRKSSRPGSAHGGLREVDVNVTVSAGIAATQTKESFKAPKIAEIKHQPPLKRQNTGSVTGSVTSSQAIPLVDPKDFGASTGSKLPKRAPVDGRENAPFSASVGAGGRNLRGRGS